MTQVLRPEEKHAFETLLRLLPDFAGRRILNWEPVPRDPPDVICWDLDERKVGVEVFRILKEEQTRRAIQHDQWGQSLDRLLRSEEAAPTIHFKSVLISVKGDVAKVQPGDEKAFRDEFFRFVSETDQLYPTRPDWHGPQGATLNDLSPYSTLSRYLGGLTFFPGRAEPGTRWASMWSRGGAYDPDCIVHRAEELIREKCNKCSGLVGSGGFDRLYCLADYNWQAFFYNTPFKTPGFGFSEFAQVLSARIKGLPNPFEEIFLVNTVESEHEVLRIWSARV